MSVNVKDRNKSKVEFDNAYFKVHDDAVNLIKNRFGANKEIYNNYKGYVGLVSRSVLNNIFELGKYIRIANSIYPQNKTEYEERRIYQGKAIGLCYDILTKYQIIMNQLRVKDDKYVNEIKHLTHEINCIKNWRKSDKKRFEKLG